MNPKLSILLVDDHELVRAGLGMLLANSQEYTIIGECKNGEEALRFIENNLVNLVMMDINMPVMDGIECTTHISQKYPNMKVLCLTVEKNEEQIKSMLKAGATGYILKDSPKEIVLDALDAVSTGKRYYSDEITSTVMDSFSKSEKLKKTFGEITERELEVLKLIVDEKSNREIADILFVSVRTVDAHRRSLLEKSGAKNVVGLIKYAYKHELI